MPKGEPTKTVRLPLWFIDLMEPLAARSGNSVAEHIVKRMAPRDSPLGPVLRDGDESVQQRRCQCSTPTISKVVTNLCTTCKRLR